MAEITVDSADLRTLVAVFTCASRAFGSYFGAVPGFGDALEASARMEIALAQAQMPPCPVSSDEQQAIIWHATLQAIEAAGFDHHEAFQMVMAQVTAAATAAAAIAIGKAASGG